jgi:hypothetical protein
MELTECRKAAHGQLHDGGFCNLVHGTTMAALASFAPKLGEGGSSVFAVENNQRR